MRRAIYFAALFNALSHLKIILFISKNYDSMKELGLISKDAKVAPELLPEVFIGYLLLLFLGLVLNISNRAYVFLICVGTFYTNLFVPTVLDGGNNLNFIVMIFLLLCNEKKREADEQGLKFRAFATLVFFQLVVLYSTSAVYKLQTESWVRGVALFNTLMSLEYSTPLITALVSRTPTLFLVLSNYLVILFQATFWAGAYFERIRPYYIFFGVLMHVGIAFFMGLPSFSISVLACYVILLSNDTCDFIYHSYNTFTSRFLVRWGVHNFK